MYTIATSRSSFIKHFPNLRTFLYKAEKLICFPMLLVEHCRNKMLIDNTFIVKMPNPICGYIWVILQHMNICKTPTATNRGVDHNQTSK